MRGIIPKIKRRRVLKYISSIQLGTHNRNMKKIPALYNFSEDPNTDYYLALLGNITFGYYLDPECRLVDDFMKNISKAYKQIFYIPGSFEYTNTEGIEKVNKNLQLLNHRYPNIHIMKNDVYTIKDTAIVGSTLWSHVSHDFPWSVDTICIRTKPYTNLTISERNQWHQESVKFLQQQLPIHDKIIMLTSHAPLPYNPLAKNPLYNMFRYYELQEYLNDLEYMMGPPITTWLHGSCQYQGSFTHPRGTLVGANQYAHPEYTEPAFIEF